MRSQKAHTGNAFFVFVSSKALAKGDDAMQAVKIGDFKRA